jgi:hypothetical protein
MKSRKQKTGKYLLVAGREIREIETETDKVQNAKGKMQSAKRKVQNVKYKAQSVKVKRKQKQERVHKVSQRRDFKKQKRISCSATTKKDGFAGVLAW